MRLRPLPELHCLNCFKVLADSIKKGYLKYFCDDCMKIEPEDKHELQTK
jgi:phage FluMu protein Com